MGHVLVTGATGFLGRRVVDDLQSHGLTVRALGRNRRVCQELLALGADVVRADLRDAAAMAAACQGVEAVCHAGGLSSAWGAPAHFHGVNVVGTRNVLQGCIANRVRRLIFISSPSVVFDGRDLFDVNESAPFASRFLAPYCRSKKEAETLIHGCSAEIETVILRPKAIIGPGDTSLLPRILRAAERGRLFQIGDGANRVDLTYVDNVAQAARLALESSRAVGNTYFITNGARPRIWDVIRSLLEAAQLPTNLRTVSRRAAHWMAGGCEAMAHITRREPDLTRYTAAILSRTQTYDISAAERDLGYVPEVSLEDGIQRTLSAFLGSRRPASGSR